MTQRSVYPYVHEKERALHAFRDHKLTIEHDNGVFRSLFFGKPGTGNYHFRLTTWPGHLCISGDIGTYVFARTRDMFEFFATSDDWASMPISINADYWAEKLQADGARRTVQKDYVDVQAIRKYAVAAFRELNRSDFAVRQSSGKSWRLEAFQDLRRDLEFIFEDDSVEGMYHTVSNLHLDSLYMADNRDHYLLPDAPYEYPFTRSEYDFSFLICCYAIVWGIKRFAQERDGRSQAAHDVKIVGMGVC